MVSFLSNSASDFVATETVGGFNNHINMNSFDDIFTEAYNQLMVNGCDVKVDINTLIKNQGMLAAYKEALLDQLATETASMNNDMDREYGTHSCLYEQISDMFDNCANDLVTEATRTGTLLPIKAVDFPVLIKQQLKLASKDIIQTEVTKSPIIKKHIEQTYVVDPASKKRWKYPQCFFTDEFKEIYKAGKGLPINPTGTLKTLPIYEFDVLDTTFTPGATANDELSLNLFIEKVQATITGTTYDIVLPQPMRVNLSDGTWLGGKIDTEVEDTSHVKHPVKDIVSGFVDYSTRKVTLNSAAGVITGVYISGTVSNERNERAVTFDYAREEREWKIEDGMRVDVPYSLEELEDVKALMDIDLYKKTYNNIADILTQMEDSTVLSWLDDQFKKYDGVELDPLQWNSFITKDIFDCNGMGITTALPNEYIEKMFKFKIDRLLQDIADKVKMDDFTFVIYGNPRFISLLDSAVNWVTRPGSVTNGVKLDYGYGITTSGDIKVQVVSTKKVNAAYDKVEKTFNGIRIIPYPLSEEQFTFKHYKYTTHILTSQNSAYRSPNLPGGSYTYLMGTSRYTNAAVQGIQAQVKLSNLEKWVKL